MNPLKDKIINRESGIILYGLTPPKLNTEDEKIQQIANKQIERLEGIGIDGLILYDLQDESTRNNTKRTFPFIETLAPDKYAQEYLTGLDLPKIVYKSVGKFDEDNFEEWLNNHSSDFTVLVGSPSKIDNAGISLSKAYSLLNNSKRNFLLGGVIIPERHQTKGDEHIRVFDKVDKGCSFFISQCVYDINYAKNFLSDYYYYAIYKEKELLPIIFSLTPCGSVKTLQFAKWLGIQIPKWLENDLFHTKDILSNSLDTCKNIALELLEFCNKKNIPIGFNIESVAINREEIDASIELLKWLKI